IVWQRPGLIGSPGWVRSSAWIWLFFVEREHHGVGRRIDIEPDDVGQFGGKARIARALKGPQAMWAVPRETFAPPPRPPSIPPGHGAWAVIRPRLAIRGYVSSGYGGLASPTPS